MGNFAARVAPETLLAAMNGRPWAIELVAEAYWPTAYRLAVVVLGHQGPDAEDAAQDATISLTRGITRLADSSRAGAWGAVIAVRSAQRVRRRQENTARLDEVRVASADWCPEDMLDTEAALRALPPDLRLALVLHVVFGYSSSEVGSMLGVPDGTVRYRISRARDRLRNELYRAPRPVVIESRKDHAAVR